MCRLQCVKAQAEPTHHLIRQLNQLHRQLEHCWSRAQNAALSCVGFCRRDRKDWHVWKVSVLGEQGWHYCTVIGCSCSSADHSLALNTAGPGDLSSRAAHQRVTPGRAFQGIECVKLRPRLTISQWICLLHFGNNIRACCIKVVL